MRWLLVWHRPGDPEPLGELELRKLPTETPHAPARTTHEVTIPAGVILNFRYESEDDL